MPEFIVQLVVTSTHEYSVHAHDEEEAVSKAEGSFDSGDVGERLEYDVESADAYLLDDQNDDEGYD